MTELNGPNFSVSKISFNGVQKQPQEVSAKESESAPKLTDFSDPKAEALGRSMLVKDADNVNHDLKVLLDNPQIAENSDAMFETAYNAAKSAGIENPYEEAATFSTGNV